MKISVIVLAWNGMDYLDDCLGALCSQPSVDLEPIVVDNASTDGSPDFVATYYPQARLIRNEHNLGFAAGCNVGLRAATGDVLVLLNQDTVVQRNWSEAVARAFEDLAVGVVGCKILELDGKTLEHAGGYLLMPVADGKHYGVGEYDTGQYDQSREVEYVTGAALALRRTVYEQVGGFDEQFFPGYYEDVDLCVRVRQAGFEVLYCPDAVVYHHGSGSFGKGLYSKHHLSFRNRIRFLFKHFPPNEILGSTIPALAEAVRSERSPDVLHGVVMGSLDALFLLSELRDVVDPETRLCVLRALRGLHDNAVQREWALMERSPEY